jgi:phage FluMu protein gp41
MLGWSEFKWPVTEPPGLIDAIKQIESLAESDFLRLQQAGQEYAAAYLKPVTEEGLARFLED